MGDIDSFYVFFYIFLGSISGIITYLIISAISHRISSKKKGTRG